jgi:hypothetical protein
MHLDKIIADSYLTELKTSINKKYAHRTNKALMQQATAVVEQFENLIKAGEDLRTVQRYIKETQLVIENPTKDNVIRLCELGKKAQGEPSLLFHALGLSLMLLGAVMFAAGILIGLTIAPGIGITLGGIGLFATGLATYHYEKGLSKDLTQLSQSIDDTLINHESGTITI